MTRPLGTSGLAVNAGSATYGAALEERGEIRGRALALVVFHQYLSWERDHGVHVAGRRDRAGEMRDDADAMGIARRHDLRHLGDAADVRQRRAGEVDVALFDEW